jgi:hypothetical protein
MPFYVMMSILTGVGFYHYLLQKHRVVCAVVFFACAFLPIAAYAAAPTMAKKVNFAIAKREIPYRDEYKWFLQPWLTGYYGAEQFAHAVFETVEPNAIVYADSTTVCTLLYEQEVKGRRPDVKIVSTLFNSVDAPLFNQETMEQLLKEKPIYAVSAVTGYIPQWLMERYSFEKVGPIWKVITKKG